MTGSSTPIISRDRNPGQWIVLVINATVDSACGIICCPIHIFGTMQVVTLCCALVSGNRSAIPLPRGGDQIGVHMISELIDILLQWIAEISDLNNRTMLIGDGRLFRFQLLKVAPVGNKTTNALNSTIYWKIQADLTKPKISGEIYVPLKNLMNFCQHFDKKLLMVLWLNRVHSWISQQYLQCVFSIWEHQGLWRYRCH